jgi:hypothetical protein
MRRTLPWLALLIPLAAHATDYLTIDDTTKSFLSALVGCSGASNAITYNTTTHTFGCNSIGGGPGGTNTASNLGGGLDNYDSASGTDLRFNTFWANDFDLASNLFKIDDTKWATDAQVATAILAHPPFNHVTASADLAGNPAVLEGVDITAAIAACGSGPCYIDLVAGTYTNVCNEITRDHTYFIGRGNSAVTILQPYADLDDCVATGNTEQGEMLGFRAVDDIELANVELHGHKDTLDVASCNESFCGSAIREFDSGAGRSVKGWIHDVYIHDFAGMGLETAYATDWIIENSVFDKMGCNQDTSNSCGCHSPGDGGNCRGWGLTGIPADAAAGAGHANGAGANIMAFSGATRNSVFRHNVTGAATHAGIEIDGDCLHSVSLCPDNNELSDNVVSYDIVSNGGNHSRFLRNRISNVGIGIAGESNIGIKVTSQAHENLTIADNVIQNCAGGGILLKSSGIGHVTIANNHLSGNCATYADNADIWIYGSNGAGDGVYPRDLTVQENTAGAAGCLYALKADSSDGQPFEGAVQFIGGKYIAGSTGTVKLDGTSATNLLVRGLEITGNLVFDANAHGMAMANTVSGSTTNTGGMCIWENDSTPIPDSCVGNGVDN